MKTPILVFFADHHLLHLAVEFTSERKLFPLENVLSWADEECEKVFLSGLHPPSTTVPPLPEGKGYLLDDGFCDFAFGSAQNDSIAGVVQVSYLNEGRVQSCSWEADSTDLTIRRRQTGVKRDVIEHFQL